MDKYDAMRELIKTIIPCVLHTKWEEPIRIATEALREEIQREEGSCETCRVNPIADEVRRVVEE